MTYSKEELEHFAKLLEFFGEDAFGGDYPFVVDDRMLDNLDIVKKKVYRNGKRRSVLVYPVSVQTQKGRKVVSLQCHGKGKPSQEKQYSNPFITFVIHRWDKFVTKSQRRFVQDMLAGNEEDYSKQLRYKYRTNIQKRLKMGFIGVGGDSLSIYKIGEIRSKINLINKFIDSSHDNDLYSREIRRNIDKQYVNILVYDRMSEEGRQAVVDFVTGKADRIPSVYLYEFHDLLMEDHIRFEIAGLK